MPHYRLAFLGFGNVGRALADLLEDKRQELETKYDLTFSVTGIATGSHGRLIRAEGLDARAAARLVEAGGSLDEWDGLHPADAFDFIRQCPADVLFENTPVNHADGQPAIDHIRTALEAGMHVCTANKGPVVHAWRELQDLAASRGLRFYHESTVMDGAPIFSLFRAAIPAARLRAFHGVLNSTTNLILTRMEGGESFAEAVRYAQEIGLAETDPSGDIDGWDAAIKVAALITVLMETPFTPQMVARQGIRHITPQMVAAAKAEGYRYKLVCRAERTEAGVRASVAPEKVPQDSPMYPIEGSTSIITFQTDVLGDLTLIEKDPGPQTTAYGLLADFINAVRA